MMWPACDDHITYGELLPLAQHIRLRTALGPDGIHPWLIGHAPEPAIRVLARVFDFLWVNGVLPTQWKVANLFVLYKGAGDRSRADSYRPISLTSVVCKLYERLILARMVASFHLDPAQAGFRAGFSCLDQVYQVVDRVYDAFDRLSEVDYAFLDLSKAFDRVWHAGLLHKLRMRGASPQMWLFWRSFLSGRSFRVAQGGCFSDSFPVTAGVPQGAVVSPMAFCLFIDDLPAICRKTGAEVHLFADDIAARGRVVYLVSLNSSLPWPWERCTSGLCAGGSPSTYPSLFASASPSGREIAPLAPTAFPTALVANHSPSSSPSPTSALSSLATSLGVTTTSAS